MTRFGAGGALPMRASLCFFWKERGREQLFFWHHSVCPKVPLLAKVCRTRAWLFQLFHTLACISSAPSVHYAEDWTVLFHQVDANLHLVANPPANVFLLITGESEKTICVDSTKVDPLMVFVLRSRNITSEWLSGSLWRVAMGWSRPLWARSNQAERDNCCNGSDGSFCFDHPQFLNWQVKRAFWLILRVIMACNIVSAFFFSSPQYLPAKWASFPSEEML